MDLSLDDIASGALDDGLGLQEPASDSSNDERSGSKVFVPGTSAAGSKVATSSSSDAPSAFVQSVVEQERDRLSGLLARSSADAARKVEQAFEASASAFNAALSSQIVKPAYVIAGSTDAPQVLAPASGVTRYDVAAPRSAPPNAAAQHLARRASLGMGFGTTQPSSHFATSSSSSRVLTGLNDTSYNSQIGGVSAGGGASRPTAGGTGTGGSGSGTGAHPAGNASHAGYARQADTSPTRATASDAGLGSPVKGVVDAAVRAERIRAGDSAATAVRGLCTAITDYVQPALHAAVPTSELHSPSHVPPSIPDAQVLGLQLGLSETGVRAVKRLFTKLDGLIHSVATAHAQSVTKKAKELQSELQAASSRSAELERRLVEAIAALSASQEQHATSHAASSAADVQSSNVVAASLRSSAVAIQGSLQSELNVARQEMLSLREALSTAAARVTAADGRASVERERCTQAVAELDRLRDRLTASESAREQAIAQREAALSDWESTTRECARLQEEVRTGHAAFRLLQAQVDKLDSRGRGAEGMIDSIVAERDELRQSCNELRVRLAAADVQIAAYEQAGKAEAEAVASERERALAAELTDARDALTRAQEDIARLRAHLINGDVLTADFLQGLRSRSGSPSRGGASASYVKSAVSSWGSDLAALTTEVQASARRAARADEVNIVLTRQLQEATNRVASLELQLERVQSVAGLGAAGSLAAGGLSSPMGMSMILGPGGSLAGSALGSPMGSRTQLVASLAAAHSLPAPTLTGGSVTLQQLHEAVEKERRAAAAALADLNKRWEVRQQELVAAAEAGRAAGSEQAEKVRAEAGKALTALSQAREDAMAMLLKTEAQLGAARAQVLELEAQVLAAKNEAQSCRDSMSRLEVEVASIRAGNAKGMEVRLAEAEASVSSAAPGLQEKILQQRSEDLQASLRTVQSELASVSKDKARLMEQLAAREEQKRRLELMLSEALDTTEATLDRAAAMTGGKDRVTLASLKAEVETARSEATRSASEIRSLREQVKSLQAALTDASASARGDVGAVGNSTVVALLRQQLADADTRLQSERDSAVAKLKRLSSSHGQALEALRAQHERHIEALSQQREAAIAAVRAETEQTLREKDISLEKSAGSLSSRVASLQSIITDLEARCSVYEEASAQVTQLQEALLQKDEALARAQSQHAKAASEASATVQACRARVQELEATLTALRKNEASLREELSALIQRNMADRQSLLAAHAAELDAARSAQEKAVSVLRHDMSTALNDTLREIREAADAEVLLLREAATRREADLLAEREALATSLAQARAEAQQAAIAAAAQLASAQEAASTAAAEAARQLADQRKAASDAHEAALADSEETLRRVRESSALRIAELMEGKARAEEAAAAMQTACALAKTETERTRVEMERVREEADAVRTDARRDITVAREECAAEVTRMRAEAAAELARERNSHKAAVEQMRQDMEVLRTDTRAEVERVQQASSAALSAAATRAEDLQAAVKAAEAMTRARVEEAEAVQIQVSRLQKELTTAKAQYESSDAELTDARTANEALRRDIADVRARLDAVVKDAAALAEQLKEESARGTQALKEAYHAEVEAKNRELLEKARELEQREHEVKRRMEHAAAAGADSAADKERLASTVKELQVAAQKLREQVAVAETQRDQALLEVASATRHASAAHARLQDEMEVAARQLSAAKERERQLMTRLSEERDRTVGAEEEMRRRVSAAEEDARRRIASMEEDSRRKLADAEGTLSVIRERLTSATRESDAARSEAKASSDAAQRLRDELAVQRRQAEAEVRQALEGPRSELERRAALRSASLEADIRRLQEEAAAAKTAAASQVSALRAEHAAEVRVQQHALDASKARISQLEAALSEVEKLRGTADRLREKNADAEAVLFATRGEADRLRAEVERLQAERSGVKTTAERVRVEADTLSLDLRHAQEETLRANRERSLLAEQVADLQARVSTLRAERDELDRRLDTAQQARALAIAEADALKREAVDARDSVTGAKLAAGRMEDFVRSVKAEQATEKRLLEERAAQEVSKLAGALKAVQGELHATRQALALCKGQYAEDIARAASVHAEELARVRIAHAEELSRMRAAQEIAISQVLETTNRQAEAADAAQAADGGLFTPARFFAARGAAQSQQPVLGSSSAIPLGRGRSASISSLAGGGGVQSMAEPSIDELRRRAARILLAEADSSMGSGYTSHGQGHAASSSSSYLPAPSGPTGDGVGDRAYAPAASSAASHDQLTTEALSVLLGARVLAAAQKEVEAAAQASLERDRVWRDAEATLVSSMASLGMNGRRSPSQPAPARVGVQHSEVTGVSPPQQARSYAQPTPSPVPVPVRPNGAHIEEGIDMSYVPASASPTGRQAALAGTYPAPPRRSSLTGSRPSPYHGLQYPDEDISQYSEQELGSTGRRIAKAERRTHSTSGITARSPPQANTGVATVRVVNDNGDPVVSPGYGYMQRRRASIGAAAAPLQSVRPGPPSGSPPKARRMSVTELQGGGMPFASSGAGVYHLSVSGTPSQSRVQTVTNAPVIVVTGSNGQPALGVLSPSQSISSSLAHARESTGFSHSGTGTRGVGGGVGGSVFVPASPGSAAVVTAIQQTKRAVGQAIDASASARARALSSTMQ